MLTLSLSVCFFVGNLKMDKTWMRCTDTSSDVYLKGVDNFLQFAFQNSEVEGEIPCPCTQCNNVSNGSRDEVKEHLILFGIVKGYTLASTWRICTKKENY